MSHIIGIHIGHDASVTLLENGKPTLCVSEERFNRKKAFFGFPVNALKYLLAKTGIRPSDYEAVALDTTELTQLIDKGELLARFQQGEISYLGRMKRNLMWTLEYFVKGCLFKSIDPIKENMAVLIQGIEMWGFSKAQVRVYDHHLCHAASAFWASPFDKAFFLTSDGRGDSLSSTFGYAENNKIDRVKYIKDDSSLGQFYSAVTLYLGFEPNRHEGKITGLAAHGNPATLGPIFLQQVSWDDDGKYTVKPPNDLCLEPRNFPATVLQNKLLSLKEKIILFQAYKRNYFDYTINWYSWLLFLKKVAINATPEDVAAGVQYVLEKVTLTFLEACLADEALPVVCAGGVFANVSLNKKIRELDRVKNIFIQPAMGDDGLSLGSALLAFQETEAGSKELGLRERSCQMKHVYLGPDYSLAEVKTAADKCGVSLIDISQSELMVADLINEGFIVGIFDGAMEFGPRALGHRSILARTTDAGINKTLNERLRRTEFMPFAPSVLVEYAHECFVDYNDDHVAADFMTVTYEVEENWKKRFAAVVHVDGTARPQVVKKQNQPRFHRILKYYYDLTGIPGVINTSFNTHEEPIVCSPTDAIKSLQSGCIDVLFIQGYFVTNTIFMDKLSNASEQVRKKFNELAQ